MTDRGCSTVLIRLPDDLADDIVDYGRRRIPDEFLCRDDRNDGRELGIHLTVLHGVLSPDPDEVAGVLSRQRAFEVTLGKISLFRNNDSFDVVKIDAASAGALRVNRLLRDKIPYKNNFPDYRPHVTIAYVRKNRAKTIEGDGMYQGIEFTATALAFNSPDGTSRDILLRH